MARLSDFSAQNTTDYLLTAEGLNTSDGTPAYFTEFSGIEFERKDAEYPDGLGGVITYTEGGMTRFMDVTIAKPHDPDKDDPVFQFIEEHKYGKIFSFRCRPIKRVTNGSNVQEFRGTKSWDLTCRLLNYKVPGAIDQASAKVAKIEMKLRVENAEYK
jgi:hypothetical protein